MITKQCVICGEDIPKFYSTGRAVAPGKYQKKQTCSGSCAAEWREINKRGFGATDYPLRDCPYCNNPIPKVSKHGNVLKKGHYDQRKTCGEYSCAQAALRNANDKGVFRFKSTGPSDWFLYSMPCRF